MSEIVLITGASSGIGRETAYRFAEAGSHLFLVARRRTRLEDVAQDCRHKGEGPVIPFVADLSQPGNGELIVQECIAQLGALDVLVCNAGYGVVGPVWKVTPRQAARIWQVNFQSAFESIHAALPHFLKKKNGHIVLVSSIIGKKGMPYSAIYSATKFAQAGFGEALWGELRDKGVGVSVICPGYTRTEFQQAAEKAAEGADPATSQDDETSRTKRPVQGQSPEVVGQAIFKAVRGGKREVHLTAGGKILLLVDRISPALATRVLASLARREHTN